MFFSKGMRMTGITVISAFFTLASQGFSQGSRCCITPIQDSLVSALSGTEGISNVTVEPEASCDSFEIYWATYDPGMGHYMKCCILKYRIAGNDVKWTQNSSGITTSGTLSGWCQTAIEKSSIMLKRETALTVYPNPFQSQIRMSFENPDGHAIFEIFDMKGTRLHHETIGKTSGIVWKPVNLRQGLYLARIKTRGHVFTKNIISLN